MISTTLRDGWPSGSSVIAGYAGSAAELVRARGVAPRHASSAFAAVLYGRIIDGAGGDGGGLGFLGRRCLAMSMTILDGLGALSATERCSDFTHPLPLTTDPKAGSSPSSLLLLPPPPPPPQLKIETFSR
ncbi:hypothetical protein NL676_027966 [Syzygium grande]|nr:hypothetical protein NL676_027966 [Syzygium grande]